VIEVYISGCSTCGINALLLNRLWRTHDVTLVDSRKDAALEQHAAYLTQAGMPVTSYKPIIVVNRGERIMELAEWKSL